MSGNHAMSVCLTDALVQGADAHLSDVCLAFTETFVRMAGGVIYGVKPAAIFSIPMRAYCAGKWRQLTDRALDEALRAYGRALPGYGVRLVVLHKSGKRIYLLVWRPELMREALGSIEARQILHEHGYVGEQVGQLVSELRRRLVAYYRERGTGADAFPHEIGIFLGYPPEDVRGYLEGAQVTCRGAWCAYGDAEVARRRFRALETQERHCRMRFAEGASFATLFVPRVYA